MRILDLSEAKTLGGNLCLIFKTFGLHNKYTFHSRQNLIRGISNFYICIIHSGGDHFRTGEPEKVTD